MPTDQPQPGTAPEPPAAPVRDPARGWQHADRTMTLLLFLPFGFAAIALFQVGAIVAMQADVCGSDGVTCNYALVSTGARLASWAPLGLLIVSILATVHRLLRQRIAFWIPLAGIAAVIGAVLLADSIVTGAITRT